MDNLWQHFVHVNLPVIVIILGLGFLLGRVAPPPNPDAFLVRLYRESLWVCLFIVFSCVLAFVSISNDVLHSLAPLTMLISQLDRYISASCAAAGTVVALWQFSRQAKKIQADIRSNTESARLEASSLKNGNESAV